MRLEGVLGFLIAQPGADQGLCPLYQPVAHLPQEPLLAFLTLAASCRLSFCCLPECGQGEGSANGAPAPAWVLAVSNYRGGCI